MKRIISYTLLHLKDNPVPRIIRLGGSGFEEDEIYDITKALSMEGRQTDQFGAKEEIRFLRLPDEEDPRLWLQRVGRARKLITPSKIKWSDTYHILVSSFKSHFNIDQIVGVYKTKRDTKGAQGHEVRYIQMILRQEIEQKFFTCSEPNDNQDLWGLE